MSDLEKLLETFKQLGVDFTVRKNGEFEYVFVGDCRNVLKPEQTFETGDLDQLTMGHNFYEFENGKMASYSNS